MSDQNLESAVEIQVLRAACIHGRYEPHWVTRYPSPLCSGGREVTIDYEAAVVAYMESEDEQDIEKVVRMMVDAATRSNAS